MKYPIPLFLILLNMENATAQSYVWPTDASHLMTSSFCEYRSGHFHSGLDIKTWNREGYPVFAIDSGYVSRILVSPHGYGKAVYLRLNDGKMVVYGHLSRFADPIENEVVRRQKINQKYALDLYLSPHEFPVKCGEVLAFTGSTGVGVPHLHFEVRDSIDRPFNPLDLGYTVWDSQAPVIQTVAVSPLQYGSHVNGDFKPQIFPVGISGHISSLPVPVWGKIGISIETYDQADGASNCFSVVGLRLFGDDSLIFTTRYGPFEYQHSLFVDLDRNLQLMGLNECMFQNLYKEHSNPLDFYLPDRPDAGVLAGWYGPDSSETDEPDPGLFLLTPGMHSLRMEAEDYWGNMSSASMIIDVRPVSEVHISRGYRSVSHSSENMSADLEKTWIRDFIRFLFRTEHEFAENPELNIWLNGSSYASVSLSPGLPGEFIGALPLNGTFQGEMVCKVTAGDFSIPLWQDTAQVFYIDRNGGRLVSSDRRFHCTIPFDAVHEPAWFQVSIEQKSGQDFPVYKVIPDRVFLKRACRIQVLVSENRSKNRGAGIYSAERKNQFLPSYWDSSNMILNAYTRSLSRFTVLWDTTPPVIYSIFPDWGMVVSQDYFNIRFRFFDYLSGIGNEDHYRLRIDGRPQIVAYDPEENQAWVEYPDSLGTGDHLLELVIRDRSGNETTRVHSFSIIP